MSGKRDEDSDMEVGMTTAERRRRRRRGGGLRVPSDNVPRTRTPTAPPPPVPEDPALAMSIAYSFTNDASGPVPRAVAKESSSPPRAGEPAPRAREPGSPVPVAPEAMTTLIDPPGSSIESQDFETKTREMSAVDLEALGLSTDGSTPFQRLSAPGINSYRIDNRLDKTVELELEIDDETEQGDSPRAEIEAKARAKTTPSVRAPTVALSDDDLEEIRTTPARSKLASKDSNSTLPLSALDVEALTKSADEPVSVAEIDIQELADRADTSGEIEVDVEDDDDDDDEVARTQVVAIPNKPAAAATKPVAAPTAAPVAKPAATPAAKPTAAPAAGPTAASTAAVTATPAAKPTAAPAAAPVKPAAPPAPPADRKGAAPDAAHHPPPPLPQQVPHKPPAPPAKKPLPQAAVAAVINKEPSRPTSTRARPWFVDLFDEDYLRTLPFLTPQATQAEAEFVINAMNLAPGAQVLDLGCGYGRHAMELAARGFHVIGLDLSTPLLVRGGEEAHRRGLTINFVRGDMREIDFENQFDAAYCLFSTFGYFDDETNKKTLQNVCRALKPNGKVLVEILNRDYVIADLPTRVWWEGDGCVVLEEVELNYFSSRVVVNRSVVFDDGRQLEQEISVRAYSLHEVGKLMHAAGFRVLEVSGGYQTRGRFFGNQSRHIIVLAERKDTSST